MYLSLLVDYCTFFPQIRSHEANREGNNFCSPCTKRRWAALWYALRPFCWLGVHAMIWRAQIIVLAASEKCRFVGKMSKCWYCESVSSWHATNMYFQFAIGAMFSVYHCKLSNVLVFFIFTFSSQNSLQWFRLLGKKCSWYIRKVVLLIFVTNTNSLKTYVKQNSHKCQRSLCAIEFKYWIPRFLAPFCIQFRKVT